MKINYLYLVLALFALSPAPAAAKDTVCGADIKRLCPAAASKSDSKECLFLNRAKVSEPCRASFEASLDASEQMEKVCAEPIQKFCEHRMKTKCLVRHFSELSPDCQAAVIEKKKTRQASYD